VNPAVDADWWTRKKGARGVERARALILGELDAPGTCGVDLHSNYPGPNAGNGSCIGTIGHLNACDNIYQPAILLWFSPIPSVAFPAALPCYTLTLTYLSPPMLFAYRRRVPDTLSLIYRVAQDSFTNQGPFTKRISLKCIFNFQHSIREQGLKS